MIASLASDFPRSVMSGEDCQFPPGLSTTESALPVGRTINQYGDWARLANVVVEVRRHGRHETYARIDAATPDSRKARIAAYGNDTRRLIDKADGYELWITAAHVQRLSLLAPSPGPHHSAGLREGG